MNQIGIDILYLCGCAIRKEDSDPERLSTMNFGEIYQESKRHSLSALTFTGIGSANAEKLLFPELFREWKQAVAMSTWRNMQLNFERQEICDWMENQGIWHMPLKGSILQELYPGLGLREMTDNDILINPQYSSSIRDYMVQEREYSIYEYSPVESYDDVYQKPPLFNYEMHKHLFDEADPNFQKYYDNVKNILILDEGTKYSFHFSDENFYGYLLAHAYKHFSAGGVGLRTLTDCYVWNRKKRDSMDEGKLQRILEELGLTTFEVRCRELSEKLLGGKEVDVSNQDKEFFSYLYDSGSFGTSENSVRNKIHKCMNENGLTEQQARKRLIWKRLFPELHYYEIRAPFFYRHKSLIPLYWLYRLVKRIIAGGALNEMKMYKKTKLLVNKYNKIVK